MSRVSLSSAMASMALGLALRQAAKTGEPRYIEPSKPIPKKARDRSLNKSQRKAAKKQRQADTQRAKETT